MAAVGVYGAETDAAARRLFTSQQQGFVNLRRGAPTPLPPPVDSMEGRWTAGEQAMVEHAFREAIVGSPATLRRGIDAFVRRTDVDELMVAAAIYDHTARLRSFELVAQAFNASTPR
jgi:alkanesulfonate monooxygenase SsuD/methylene tetrahydromethanopterin reductase-like flavin-dependent oxidoreductase (luciferase family)